MGEHRRYGAFFGVLIAALVFGVIFAFSSLSGKKSLDLAHGEATDTFTVHNPQLIRPSAEAYRRFRAEDSTWRAMHAPMDLAPVRAGPRSALVCSPQCPCRQ